MNGYNPIQVARLNFKYLLSSQNKKKKLKTIINKKN